MFEIRIPHLLPFVVRHRAESFPDGHHHDHAVGLATGAEHQLGVRRRLRVNHHRHLALAFRHHGVEIFRRGFVAERTHDGARDTHADRAFPVEMFQHFRHSQPHALLRHVFQRRGHSRALELGVRRVHGSSLERVHAQLHTENNLAFGVIPATDGRRMAFGQVRSISGWSGESKRQISRRGRSRGGPGVGPPDRPDRLTVRKSSMENLVYPRSESPRIW